MKRIILLCCLLLATLASGCGSKGTDDGNANLVGTPNDPNRAEVIDGDFVYRLMLHPRFIFRWKN